MTDVDMILGVAWLATLGLGDMTIHSDKPQLPHQAQFIASRDCNTLML